MRRELILRISVAAVALVVGSGIAAAQSPAPTAPSPSAQTGLSRQVALSPAEQVAQADGLIARMDAAGTTVRRQLDTARKQRDVVKTLCLNDKLNQLDVAIRSARDRKAALASAAARNDGDLATHEFTILSVLRQRSDQLTAEANQCIGITETFVGERAEVTVQIESNMPVEDPTSYPSTTVIVQPPACSSCVQ
jgi:hypothetical protein